MIPLTPALKAAADLVTGALCRWDLPAVSTARLINLSENVTYLIEAPAGFKAVLRLHRASYHSVSAIRSELAWLTALNVEGGVVTPTVRLGQDGEAIQTVMDGSTPRHMVLFDYIEGAPPDETGDLVPGFEALGILAARCHAHVLTWERPPGFQRLTWDRDAVFGPSPIWGNWRAGPGVDTSIRPLLERVERTLTARLTRFGRAPERFNLIHADMRLANIIIAKDGLRLIDFDDCGMGWLLYDFAAAISFMEDDPRVPALKAAWLDGYRSVRALGAEDEAEIETLVMLRRMALLAWIGSHAEAPEPQSLAPHFASGTALLGEAYLSRFGSVSPTSLSG